MNDCMHLIQSLISALFQTFQFIQEFILFDSGSVSRSIFLRLNLEW